MDNNVKYSDDGEPKGTAGIRILNAIEHFDLMNQLVIVIRYFGGTNLGVGPLGKTYYNCAYKTLENSPIKKSFLLQRAIIKSDFNNLNQIHRVLENYKILLEDIKYEDIIFFNCFIKPSVVEAFSIELSEVTKGKAEISISNQYFYK